MIWVVDADDCPSIRAVESLSPEFLHTLVVGPRAIPAKLWNDAWRAAKGDIFGMFGDDLIIHAPGWDRMVEDAFSTHPDRIALVYGPDGFRNQIHASHPFLSREWCAALGYFSVEHFGHEYNDTWMNDLAGRIERRHYVPDLWIQHLHPDDPSLGVVMDATYRENQQRVVNGRVRELYESPQMESMRVADALRLRAVMS